jgi:hypothetical protein
MLGRLLMRRHSFQSTGQRRGRRRNRHGRRLKSQSAWVEGCFCVVVVAAATGRRVRFIPVANQAGGVMSTGCRREGVRFDDRFLNLAKNSPVRNFPMMTQKDESARRYVLLVLKGRTTFEIPYLSP